MTAFELCVSTLTGSSPVRCFMLGDEPVAVVYDFPTGRHPAMTHQIIRSNPNLATHVQKAMVDTRTGLVITRSGVREMHRIYSSLAPHREDTRIANQTFLTWMENELLPHLDDMDARNRLTKAGILPVPALSASITVKAGATTFQAEFKDVDTDTIRMSINGVSWTMTVRQFADLLSRPTR